MAEVRIVPTDNGPYQVKGTIELVDAAGNTWQTKETTWLCRCGHSSNKPFCDGTHKKVGFASVERTSKPA
ncbi:MAG TPA: CDGSH iron-sulfur domain-containing protein [bacterium]|nr:CDGSH iron-sulfur domain-containing protein [bacterium]